MKDGPYTSNTIMKLFENLSSAEDSKLFKLWKSCDDVEQNVRNFAAHEIVSVTEEWIEKEQV